MKTWFLQYLTSHNILKPALLQPNESVLQPPSTKFTERKREAEKREEGEEKKEQQTDITASCKNPSPWTHLRFKRIGNCRWPHPYNNTFDTGSGRGGLGHVGGRRAAAVIANPPT